MSLRPVLGAEAFVACVQAAADAHERLIAQNGSFPAKRATAPIALDPATGKQVRGFALMTREKADAARAKGVATRQKGSAKAEYGFTDAEFQDYGVARAKGFSREEAADIVLRSRRILTSEGG